MEKADINEFNNYSRDLEIETQLETFFEKHKISPLDAVRRFPIYSRRIHLRRFLAHYELFRQTVDLPGDIVELGFFRGLSLMTWANFLEVHQVSDRRKRVLGFDTGKGLTGVGSEDQSEAGKEVAVQGTFAVAEDGNELKEAIEIFDHDRFVPWKPRVELIYGDVRETVPAYVEQNPGLRISLLHFDMDIYEPTKVGLEVLFPKVVRNGIVVFDEYGVLEWPGETKAVDEFFEGTDYVVRKFPWAPAPGGYVIKK
jgi:hypothetical protein